MLKPKDLKVDSRVAALARAYHAHHFQCKLCIAAGTGAINAKRCPDGLALWKSYQSS